MPKLLIFHKRSGAPSLRAVLLAPLIITASVLIPLAVATPAYALSNGSCTVGIISGTLPTSANGYDGVEDAAVHYTVTCSAVPSSTAETFGAYFESGSVMIAFGFSGLGGNGGVNDAVAGQISGSFTGDPTGNCGMDTLGSSCSNTATETTDNGSVFFTAGPVIWDVGGFNSPPASEASTAAVGITQQSTTNFGPASLTYGTTGPECWTQLANTNGTTTPTAGDIRVAGTCAWPYQTENSIQTPQSYTIWLPWEGDVVAFQIGVAAGGSPGYCMNQGSFSFDSGGGYSSTITSLTPAPFPTASFSSWGCSADTPPQLYLGTVAIHPNSGIYQGLGGTVEFNGFVSGTYQECGSGTCAGPLGNLNGFAVLSYPVNPLGGVPSAELYGGNASSILAECSCTNAQGYAHISHATTGLGSATVKWLQAQAKAGDPVDTATGDFSQSATDLTLPGGGPQLAFTRTYDAQAAQAEITAAVAPGPLGYGWANNFGMNVSYNTITQVATVTEENGAQTTFSPYVSGTSPAWCTGVTNFCASAPRVAATLNQNGGSTWTYVRNAGAPEHFAFNSSGTLTSYADALGNTISSSTYSPTGGQTVCPSSNTCVAWTSSTSGRMLVVATNSSSQITSVFDANSSLAASFTYTGTGCSTFSSNPDLCTATDPGSILTSYTYDSSNPTAALASDMLTENPPGSATATVNQYNGVGQVSQQTDPSGNVTTFTYVGVNSSLNGGTTTITDYPNGFSGTANATLDVYSSNVLTSETTGYDTSSADTTTYIRDPTSLAPLQVIDGNGNATTYTYQTYSGTGGTQISSANVLTQTDGAGNTAAHAYNAGNLPWCTVDPADYANGARCPSSAPSAPPAPGVTDPNLGMVIAYYNASDQLIASTDALGNTTMFSYTTSGSGVPIGLLYCSVAPVDYQKSVKCPTYGSTHVTGTATSTYDAAGDMTASTDALGNTTSYAYGLTSTQPGLPSTVTDAAGNVITLSYNGAGEITSKVVTFGSYSATSVTAYDSHGRPYCTVSAFEYAKGVTCPGSPPSPPSPSSDPYTGATIINYDAAGRVAQTTNPLGGITLSAYDGTGQLYCTVAPIEAKAGVTCPSDATALTTPTPGSDLYLSATITTYDASERPIQVTNPLGGITLTAYDPAGNVSSTTTESNNSTSDPNVVTTFTYTPDNQVASITNSSGTSLYSYGPNRNQYCSVSPNAYAAGSTTYQCPAWQASWIANVPSPSSLYSSTPTASQANNVTMDFHNANGQLVQSTDPDVHTTITAYDANGDSYCSSDPVNVASYLTAHSGATYPYLCPATPPATPPATGSNPGYSTIIRDAAGNVLSSTNQLGDTTSYAYGPVGNVLTVTNPLGKVTTNCYYYENGTGACAHGAPATGGSADALYSTLTPATTADPSGELTTFAYYSGGAPDVIVTPAATTTYAYDALGDKTSTSYTGVQSGYSAPTNLTYTYNVDGSTNTMTDATGTTTYGYDANGDVMSQAFVANSPLSNKTVSYTYFSTGDLATEVYPSYTGHANPTVTYAYNDTGQMASSTDWLSNTINYSYDHNGNLTSQANPNSTTTNSYDAADNLTSTSSAINQTCGGPENLLQSFGSSGSPTGSRNADGQLSQYGVSFSATCSGQTSYQRNYSYDVAGDVVYQGATAQGSSANNFIYDAATQLTQISEHVGSSFNSYTQTFDNAGEVTGQSPISGSGGSAATYTYNTLGDQLTISSPSTTYTYNAAGQVTSFTTASGVTTYLYNGLGLASSALLTPPVAWGSATSIDSTRAIKAETCTSATFCVAVGASGYAAVWNGTSWTTTDVDSTRTLDAVTCTSSSFCVAGDTSGYAVIYTGSWGTPSDVDGTRSISSISCTSSTFCEAVGASGYAAKYTGTWASSSDIDSSRNLTAVSCVSTSFCEAVDASGDAAKYTGSWATAAVIDSGKDLSALSCQSTTFCEAVDTSGRALKYTSSWGSAASIDSTRAIDALTCTSSSFCIAVGASGYAAVYTGTWASSTDVDGSRTMDAVSCASTIFCVAIDSSGYQATYTGTWVAPTDIDGANALSAVSCPTNTHCVAVDGSGNGVTYSQPSSSISQLTWDTSSGLPLVIADASDYYIYGPGITPAEQVGLSSSTPTFLNYTPDSSTYVATNAAGDLVGFWGYDAYGNLAFGTPNSAFGYAGQYTDASSGLSNMRARFYQSQTGGFTTRDPLFSQTDAAYGYAAGDGVNGTDPSGLSFWSSLGDTVYAVATSPGTSLWHAADHIYQNGANGCSFFSAKNLEDVGGFTLIWTGDAFTVYGVGSAVTGVTLAGVAAEGETAADQAAYDYATQENKLDHLFDAKHNFEPLVQQFGSRGAVVRQILDSINGLTPQSGTFEITTEIGGQSVVVRGSVINGVVKIGTAFTP